MRELIRHAALFSKDATEANFRSTLAEAVTGAVPASDPFDWKKVSARAASSGKMMAAIEADPSKLEAAVLKRMTPYAPPNVDFDATVHLVAGGTSDGFVPGGGNDLYVAVQYFEDDFEGLALLTAHELYHVLQNRVAPPKKSNSEAAALLRATMKEGTGTVVGDPLIVAAPGGYTKWFQEKYRRNLAHVDQNFALFEMMLFTLAHDPASKFERFYPLGFSGGAWDSNLYFVGYRMAKVIERHDGTAAIGTLMTKDPAEFFARYIELTKSDHAPDVIPLTKTTEAIVASLR